MRNSGNVITIPKRITNGRELIILTREEYDREVRRSKEIVETLRVIAEGEKAYRTGRTKVASSLEKVLKTHGKR